MEENLKPSKPTSTEVLDSSADPSGFANSGRFNNSGTINLSFSLHVLTTQLYPIQNLRSQPCRRRA